MPIIKPPVAGLIPAGAGKTSYLPALGQAPVAHPRRCGENDVLTRLDSPVTGSSPQVRGKRNAKGNAQSITRLIPAGAGKT